MSASSASRLTGAGAHSCRWCATQVWAMDIMYIPMAKGLVSLTVVLDWSSRRGLAWRLSNTLGPSFCVEALEEAPARHVKPDFFNTDQGSQSTGGAVHRRRGHRMWAAVRGPPSRRLASYLNSCRSLHDSPHSVNVNRRRSGVLGTGNLRLIVCCLGYRCTHAQ